MVNLGGVQGLWGHDKESNKVFYSHKLNPFSQLFPLSLVPGVWVGEDGDEGGDVIGAVDAAGPVPPGVEVGLVLVLDPPLALLVVVDLPAIIEALKLMKLRGMKQSLVVRES